MDFTKSISVLAILSAASQFATAQTIENMGILPTGTTSQASACSADGVWIGGFASVGSVSHAARWTTPGTLLDCGLVPGFTVSLGYGISNNGSVIAGQLARPTGGERAFRWTSSGGMVDLGTLPGGTRSQGWGCSGDGLVVSGFSSSSGGDRAFRWTSSTGMQSLGLLPSGTMAFGFGISNNGQVITGYGDTVGGNRAFRWTSSGGMQSLGVAFGGTYSVGWGCNTDGSAIVGYGNSAWGDGAVRWTAAGGMQYLGTLPTSTTGAQAKSVTSNGRCVVGTSGFGTTTHAFGWSPNGGMIDLNTFLPTVGVNLTGWDLKDATAISADGTTIVGSGRLNNALRGFVIRGIPCFEPPVIIHPPFPTQSCRAGAASFTVEIEPTGSPTYQWQIESPLNGLPGQAEWVDLIDGPVPGAEETLAVNVHTPQLNLFGCSARAARPIRVIIYNPCSSGGGTASAPVRLSYCEADYNCDSSLDFFDYLDFVAGFSAGTPQADFNTDGAIDFFDYLDFVGSYSAGCV